MSDAAQEPADYVTRILAAAGEYRVGDCNRLLGEACGRLPPERLIGEVLSPLLREAGDRWEKGSFSVVQEHLLTSAVRRELTWILDRQNRAADGPCLAFTTLSGERHEMGSLMLAVIATSRGVHAVYLGPDLPVAEVGRFCGRVQVAAVAISLVTKAEVIDAPAQLAELRAVLPASIPIWLGGHAAESLDDEELPENALVIRDLAEFDLQLAALAARSEPR